MIEIKIDTFIIFITRYNMFIKRIKDNYLLDSIEIFSERYKCSNEFLYILKYKRFFFIGI
jgi:hypothetical protein